MRAQARSWLVVCVSLCTASLSVAQTPVGALAIDARQGAQWGWAVDYETPAAAGEEALRECGTGCSVVLTFERCGAYAADEDADSTAVGWGNRMHRRPRRVRRRCGSAVRAVAVLDAWFGFGAATARWSRRGWVWTERLAPDPAGAAVGRFRLWRADGLFGPRTRAAIRGWQSSRGARPTGYLDGPASAALRTAGASGARGAGGLHRLRPPRRSRRPLRPARRRRTCSGNRS